MTFSITIGDSKVRNDDGTELTCATFDFDGEFERCWIPVNYWRVEDYLLQWREALSRCIKERKSSAIVTSIFDECEAANIMAWILYPLPSGDIVIQQHMLLRSLYVYDKIKIDYSAIPLRMSFPDDGPPASEWVVSAREVASYMTAILGKS